MINKKYILLKKKFLKKIIKKSKKDYLVLKNKKKISITIYTLRVLFLSLPFLPLAHLSSFFPHPTPCHSLRTF